MSLRFTTILPLLSNSLLIAWLCLQLFTTSITAQLKAVAAMTPEEAFTNAKSSVSHIKVLGCDAYFHISDDKRTKFESKTKKCNFHGYSMQSKAYRLWDLESKSLVINRDVHLWRLSWMTSGFKLSSQLKYQPHRSLLYQTKMSHLQTPHLLPLPLKFQHHLQIRSLFLHYSLSRICNSLNAFCLFHFSKIIPSYSSSIVPVWQYKVTSLPNNHFTNVSPIWINRIYIPFFKNFVFSATYKQALLFGCLYCL